MTAPDRSFGANEHASALTAVRAHPEVVGLLLAVAALAWWLTAVRMAGMDIGPGSDLGGLGWFAVVWMVMTAAMMLPTFAPAAAVYSAITVRHPSRPLLVTGGYLLVWSVAGVGVWLLFDAVKHLLAGQLAWRGGGRPAAVGVLALAAMYQLTPAKRACLGRCRTPLRCIRPRRRDLVSGALISGLRAGGWCWDVAGD